MKTAHTPTPYKLATYQPTSETRIIDDNGETLAFINAAPEKAAFIVKTVNCHDDLVIALQGLLYCVTEQKDSKWFERSMGLAKEALAKAKGES